jgi:hypothetical protein
VVMMRRRAGTRTDLDVLETLRARDRDIAARSPRRHMRGARHDSAPSALRARALPYQERTTGARFP